ncbi:MAG TPA: UDP-N-acetylmuramoyl-L-alanine--D-glutamate ligase [Gammaproteobacteria bacterium]|nr:UDP-N-acetylmuramoyl-L-alanine--D-glutamate ligase [Gammaproteobacteria bacterium]
MRTAIKSNDTTEQMAAPMTLIVGLGSTGLSCVRFLAGRDVRLAVIDSRDHPPGLQQLRDEFPDVALFTGAFDADVFEAAQRLVVSPGVSLKEPVIQQAISRGVEVIGDVELFLREVSAPVVAITGSNGKSTVTTLLGEMAKVAAVRAGVGGNLGTPVLELLDETNELYILELSSFQLETIRSLRAKAAVILNLSADHLDRYDSYEEYVQAKAVIYRDAETAVVNLDDPAAKQLAESALTISFCMQRPQPGQYGICDADGMQWLCRGDQMLLETSAIPAAGKHNQANVLAALALGETVGLPMDAMLLAIRSFRGLDHRTWLVAEIDHVRWYNDSKGTNVGACIAALEGLDMADESRSILIAGGDCKGADFSPLAAVLPNYVRALVLIGRDAPQIEKAVSGSVPAVTAVDMNDAVRFAADLANPRDRVLLSPACASFDMYQNYMQRGEAFMEAVGRLG